jgi:hypothetical protein
LSDALYLNTLISHIVSVTMDIPIFKYIFSVVIKHTVEEGANIEEEDDGLLHRYAVLKSLIMPWAMAN